MTEVYEWSDGGRCWRVPYDEIGEGQVALCLPAPSTISTKEEMRGLAERLAKNHRVVRVDWPGFGDADRFPVPYRPPLYVRFLAAFIGRFGGEAVDVVAAGHASSFALKVALNSPGRLRRLALLAPTWRGPLPTALGAHPYAWAALEALVCAPVLGPLLYMANSSRRFIAWMMRRHVYADRPHITDTLLDARVATAHQQNARFAAAAFVTGGLDAFGSRDDFLAIARSSPARLFIGMGERTPPKSLAEMRALAALPNVGSAVLPGSLAFYDEYPAEVAVALGAFLDAP